MIDLSKSYVLSFIFLFFFGGVSLQAEEARSNSFSSIRLPVDPDIPGVDFNKEGRYTFKATAVFAGGFKKTGSILLKFDKIIFKVPENGKMKKKSESISNIRSVEFTRWNGHEKGRKSFVFYPSISRITLADGSVIQFGHGIRGLNRITFVERKRESLIYSYFYDYRKNNRWVNSGKEDISYPETNPHENTVVKIVFEKRKTENILQKLLKR